MTRKHAFFRNHDSFYQFPASIFFPYLNLHDGTTIFKGEFIPSNFKGAKPVPEPISVFFSGVSFKFVVKKYFKAWMYMPNETYCKTEDTQSYSGDQGGTLRTYVIQYILTPVGGCIWHEASFALLAIVSTAMVSTFVLVLWTARAIHQWIGNLAQVETFLGLSAVSSAKVISSEC